MPAVPAIVAVASVAAAGAAVKTSIDSKKANDKALEAQEEAQKKADEEAAAAAEAATKTDATKLDPQVSATIASLQQVAQNLASVGSYSTINVPVKAEQPNYMPWILGGGAALVGIFLLMKRK